MSSRILVMSGLRWVVPALVVFGVSVQGPALRGATDQAQAAAAQAAPAPAARPAPTRQPLFFSEAWKQTPQGGEHPADNSALNNAHLELKLYGAHKVCHSPEENVKPPCIQISGTGRPNEAPVNLWTGLAQGPIAATLRDRNNYVDMRGWAKIRWITRANGFHALRPVVKLADGTAWVAERAEANPNDFVETEFTLSDLRWLRLDLDRVITINAGRGIPYYDQWQKPDLSRVDEIGFADLIPGSGHGAGGWVNLAKFEVYGAPVKR
ncbi:MAG: hypothetical protein HY657_00915 [Acidobacteria bacterium]|nr:hypothetical protein [Acidobacteriota bacterium]